MHYAETGLPIMKVVSIIIMDGRTDLTQHETEKLITKVVTNVAVVVVAVGVGGVVSVSNVVEVGLACRGCCCRCRTKILNTELVFTHILCRL